MNYNLLSGTSLKISTVCLGTMMFGAQTCEADALAIMDYAHGSGINFWDTAVSYNGGESERIVGKALRGIRNDIILATKVSGRCGPGMNDQGLSRRGILTSVDVSLERLGADYIDIYYLHTPDYQTSLEETLDTMAGLVRAGKIRYIGVSNYAAWQIADILAICEKRGYPAPVITQDVYNVITRGLEAELAPFLKAHPMSMAVYNPIAGGLLAGKHRPGKPAPDTRFALNPTYYQRYWSDENFAAVEKLTEIAREHNMTILELALRWCVSRPCVTSVISGVSKLSQLEQNIAAVENPGLSQEVLAACDEIWLSLAGTRFAYNR